MEHIRKALQACYFPPWDLHTLENKFNHKHYAHNGQTTTGNQPKNNSNNNNGSNNKNISIVVPYIHGLEERFKRTCNSLRIQVHFKWTNTIKTLLMSPKDRDNKLQKHWVIYRFKCPHINCPEEYIDKSARTFGDRFKEHLRAPSPIHHDSQSTGHSVNPECLTIVERESQGVIRNIKEAMYIHVKDPSLNRNLGHYQLPHIWDEALQDIPSLQLK